RATRLSTLSLHDALPIWERRPGPLDVRRHRAALRPPEPPPVLPARPAVAAGGGAGARPPAGGAGARRLRRDAGPRPAARAARGADRKSTRLNSSHEWISY